MVKKPEKKNISYKIRSSDGDIYDEGYNAACDDWEKFLPSEEEIRIKILKIFVGSLHNQCLTAKQENAFARQLAKAISKRIKGA